MSLICLNIFFKPFEFNLILCLVPFLFFLSFNITNAAPTASSSKQRSDLQEIINSILKSEISRENRCVHEKVHDICETCAKLTRSEVAFPLCCKNIDGVREWCQEYFDFTLKTF